MPLGRRVGALQGSLDALWLATKQLSKWLDERCQQTAGGTTDQEGKEESVAVKLSTRKTFKKTNLWKTTSSSAEDAPPIGFLPSNWARAASEAESSATANSLDGSWAQTQSSRLREAIDLLEQLRLQLQSPNAHAIQNGTAASHASGTESRGTEGSPLLSLDRLAEPDYEALAHAAEHEAPDRAIEERQKDEEKEAMERAQDSEHRQSILTDLEQKLQTAEKIMIEVVRSVRGRFESSDPSQQHSSSLQSHHREDSN